MDKKNQAILDLLSKNSRLSWKDIGEQVFMSGQAVGVRVQQMLDAGIIEKFTIQATHSDLQFIHIYMDTNQFELFETLVCNFDNVLEFHKVTGDSCYFIKSNFDLNELHQFIQVISKYGRYKISHRLKTIKI